MLDYTLVLNQSSEAFQHSSQTLSAALAQTAKRVVVSTVIAAVVARTRRTLDIFPGDVAKMLSAGAPALAKQQEQEQQQVQEKQEETTQKPPSPKPPLKSCLRSPKAARVVSSSSSSLDCQVQEQSTQRLCPSDAKQSPALEDGTEDSTFFFPSSISSLFETESELVDRLPVPPLDPVAMTQCDDLTELWNPLFGDHSSDPQNTSTTTTLTTTRRTHRRRVSWSDLDKGEPLAQKFFYAGSWDRKPFCLRRRPTQAQTNAFYLRIVAAVVFIYLLLALCFVLKFLRSNDFPLEPLSSSASATSAASSSIPNFLPHD